MSLPYNFADPGSLNHLSNEREHHSVTATTLPTVAVDVSNTAHNDLPTAPSSHSPPHHTLDHNTNHSNGLNHSSLCHLGSSSPFLLTLPTPDHPNLDLGLGLPAELQAPVPLDFPMPTQLQVQMSELRAPVADISVSPRYLTSTCPVTLPTLSPTLTATHSHHSYHSHHSQHPYAQYSHITGLALSTHSTHSTHPSTSHCTLDPSNSRSTHTIELTTIPPLSNISSLSSPHDLDLDHNDLSNNDPYRAQPTSHHYHYHQQQQQQQQRQQHNDPLDPKWLFNTTCVPSILQAPLQLPLALPFPITISNQASHPRLPTLPSLPSPVKMKWPSLPSSLQSLQSLASLPSLPTAFNPQFTITTDASTDNTTDNNEITAPPDQSDPNATTTVPATTTTQDQSPPPRSARDSYGKFRSRAVLEALGRGEIAPDDLIVKKSSKSKRKTTSTAPSTSAKASNVIAVAVSGAAVGTAQASAGKADQQAQIAVAGTDLSNSSSLPTAVTAINDVAQCERQDVEMLTTETTNGFAHSETAATTTTTSLAPTSTTTTIPATSTTTTATNFGAESTISTITSPTSTATGMTETVVAAVAQTSPTIATTTTTTPTPVPTQPQRRGRKSANEVEALRQAEQERQRPARERAAYIASQAPLFLLRIGLKPRFIDASGKPEYSRTANAYFQDLVEEFVNNNPCPLDRKAFFRQRHTRFALWRSQIGLPDPLSASTMLDGCGGGLDGAGGSGGDGFGEFGQYDVGVDVAETDCEQSDIVEWHNSYWNTITVAYELSDDLIKSLQLKYCQATRSKIDQELFLEQNESAHQYRLQKTQLYFNLCLASLPPPSLPPFPVSQLSQQVGSGLFGAGEAPGVSSAAHKAQVAMIKAFHAVPIHSQSNAAQNMAVVNFLGRFIAQACDATTSTTTTAITASATPIAVPVPRDATELLPTHIDEQLLIIHGPTGIPYDPDHFPVQKIAFSAEISPTIISTPPSSQNTSAAAPQPTIWPNLHPYVSVPAHLLMAAPAKVNKKRVWSLSTLAQPIQSQPNPSHSTHLDAPPASTSPQSPPQFDKKKTATTGAASKAKAEAQGPVKVSGRGKKGQSATTDSTSTPPSSTTTTLSKTNSAQSTTMGDVGVDGDSKLGSLGLVASSTCQNQTTTSSSPPSKKPRATKAQAQTQAQAQAQAGSQESNGGAGKGKGKGGKAAKGQGKAGKGKSGANSTSTCLDGCVGVAIDGNHCQHWDTGAQCDEVKPSAQKRQRTNKMTTQAVPAANSASATMSTNNTNLKKQQSSATHARRRSEPALPAFSLGGNGNGLDYENGSDDGSRTNSTQMDPNTLVCLSSTSSQSNPSQIPPTQQAQASNSSVSMETLTAMILKQNEVIGHLVSLLSASATTVGTTTGATISHNGSNTGAGMGGNEIQGQDSFFYDCQQQQHDQHQRLRQELQQQLHQQQLQQEELFQKQLQHQQQQQQQQQLTTSHTNTNNVHHSHSHPHCSPFDSFAEFSSNSSQNPSNRSPTGSTATTSHSTPMDSPLQSPFHPPTTPHLNPSALHSHPHLSHHHSHHSFEAQYDNPHANASFGINVLNCGTNNENNNNTTNHYKRTTSLNSTASPCQSPVIQPQEPLFSSLFDNWNSNMADNMGLF